MSRYRSIHFVINNYTFDDMLSLFNCDDDYLVFGFEKGEKGTPHIQGYMHFPKKVSHSTLQKQMPRAVIRRAQGTAEHNYEYCTKEGEWYEFGEFPSRGVMKFSKIEAVMRNPTTNFHMYTIYRRSYAQYQHEIRKDDTTVPEIYYCSADDDIEIYNHYKSEGKTVCMSPNDYDTEQVHIRSAWGFSCRHLRMLYNGIPIIEKNGYEKTIYKPEVIIITYSEEKEKQSIPKLFDKANIDCTFMIPWYDRADSDLTQFVPERKLYTI